jgi:hypothetical protein
MERLRPETASGFVAKVGNRRRRIYESSKNWTIDRDWRPWNYEARGVHQGIYSDEEEKRLKEFVVSNCVVPGIFFTNEDFLGPGTDESRSSCEGED